MPSYRARPSLLGPLAAAAGFSLGAAAGVLPSKYAHAITGDSHELVNAMTHFHCTHRSAVLRLMIRRKA